MPRQLEVAEKAQPCFGPLPKSAADVRELLAGARVLDVTRSEKEDLSDWVELMEAVEALCPVWLPAPIGECGGFRL